MTNSPPESKLMELRGKTDRQLIALIGSRLERGVQAARRDADWAAAERAYEEAEALLAVVYGASNAERRQLETRLTELREMLTSAQTCSAMRA